MIPPRIENVIPLDDFSLEIAYVTGEVRLFDMKKNLEYIFLKILKI